MTPFHRPVFTAASAERWVRLAFAAGLCLSALMVWRSQVGGDQLNLLARGWRLYDAGEWIPYGNPMSTGGKAPGGVTSLLVGLPFFLWQDHRAPTLLILLTHVLAYLLLDRTLRTVLLPAERVGLALLYWLNPWRIYFSAFLWNPNYLFLLGAVHLWSTMAQRAERRFLPSFLHAAALVLAFQIHASFLLLAVASFLLWWRKAFKLHWPAAILGALLATIPLVPWLFALVQDPAILTDAKKGFLGRGIVLVLPLLRGLLYWFRYSSLAVAGRMATLNFTDVLGLHPWLDKGLSVLAQTLPAVTVLLPIVAGYRLARRYFRPLRAKLDPGLSRRGRLKAYAVRLLRAKLDPGLSGRGWLKAYAVYSFLAAVIVFSLSPTTIMMWQGVILLHAAILPVILWLGPLARSRFAPRLLSGTRAYFAAEIALIALMAFGSPHFRCKGHKEEFGFGFALRGDHPMLHALHIQETCPWPFDVARGWFPDVIEPEPAGGYLLSAQKVESRQEKSLRERLTGRE